MKTDETDQCRTCETKSWGHESDGSLIPVWENIDDYENGEGPDYIGCTECCNMRSVDTGTERGEGQ